MDRSDAKDLGKLEGQMEQALELLRELNTRVKALEELRWKLAGAALVLGAGGGAVYGLFT